jgi:hypothetical protein
MNTIKGARNPACQILADLAADGAAKRSQE